MISHKIHSKLIVAIVIVAVVFGGLFFNAPQAKAETNREQLLLQIQQLLALITSLQQRLAEIEEGKSTPVEVKDIKIETQTNIPIIKSDALIRVQNPPILYLTDGKTYTLRPWETPMFRWDNSFEFDDSASCDVVLTYSDKTLYQTYKNTREAYGHIGTYVQVVTEYGELSKLDVDCESESEEFQASVDIDIKNPTGIGTLKAYSDSDVTSISDKIVYSEALSECLQAALEYQDDTTCIWGGVMIADIATHGEGFQPITTSFNLRR